MTDQPQQILSAIDRLKQAEAKLEHDLHCIRFAIEYAEKDEDTAAAVQAVLKAFGL